MVVRISRTDEPKANRTVLWVQGSLTREGAHWLERKRSCLLHRAGLEVVIGLTEVTFLDEQARPYCAVSGTSIRVIGRLPAVHAADDRGC